MKEFTKVQTRDKANLAPAISDLSWAGIEGPGTTRTRTRWYRKTKGLLKLVHFNYIRGSRIIRVSPVHADAIQISVCDKISIRSDSEYALRKFFFSMSYSMLRKIGFTLSTTLCRPGRLSLS